MTMSTYNANGGSSTMVLEMPSYSSTAINTPTPSSRPDSLKDQPHVNPNTRAISSTPPPPEGALPAPTTAAPQLARWNHPRINMFRVLATFWSFVVLGGNDAAYGALIPYLEEYYNVNYTVISLVFLSPIVGYTMSALTNNMIHVRYGQRGVAIIMSLSHLVAYVVISVHPPYPVLVVVFILAGYGNGLGDSGWNAWIGDMANANEILGFLHGFYGLGGAVAPLTATALITKAGWKWYQFYYLMVGAAIIEILVLVGTFWKANGTVFRAEHPQIDDIDTSGTSTPDRPHMQSLELQDQRSRAVSGRQIKDLPWYIRINPFKNPKSRTAEAVKNKVTILAAAFLLVYVGIEVSIGGWIVTFMLRVREGSPFASGLTSTGFWLGITVGRLVLGFVTARLFKTEKHAVATYLVLCVALQLMFWLIPQFVVSAVMVGLLGFFLGPMFPAAVVALTKLLPKRLHVASIGFAAALGASGACVLPFATGAIANAKGVFVLQPIVLSMLVVTLGIWLLIPKLPKQRTA